MSTNKKKVPNSKMKIFIAAGEASSDSLGYDLIASILRINPNVEIAILGGKKMESLGYKSIFPQEEISIMGYFEVITSIFKIRNRINRTVEFLANFKPNLYIAIDSRGFNFRVIERVRRLLPETKYLNYVSPTIWAYRYNRIFAIKKLFHHQFLLYPFEKKYYDEVGVPNTFIGHPLGYTKLLATKLKVVKSKYIISIFPGSRAQEIKVHLPIFLDAVRSFQSKSSKKLFVFIPTLPHLKALVESYNFEGLDLQISTDEVQKQGFLAQSKVFLTKSGTISLELMQYNIPMIVAHKISPITAFFVRRFIKVKYASIGNLLANAEIIPELMQENCTVAKISQKLLEIEGAHILYRKYLEELRNNKNILPQELAAQVIFQEILL